MIKITKILIQVAFNLYENRRKKPHKIRKTYVEYTVYQYISDIVIRIVKVVQLPLSLKLVVKI